MSGPRYAIYFAPPPDGPLWAFGSAVLGYDAATGIDCAQFCPAGLAPATWRAMTADPRRYGFHATLKAPFHLREGKNEDTLVEAVKAFARDHESVHVPALTMAALGSFVALVPHGGEAELATLAAAAVESFESFRAPLGDADLARRLSSRLSEREREHLARWGYPYVLDCFRFHMTLSGSLPRDLVETVRRELSGLYSLKVGATALSIDAVALYRQETRETPFRLLSRTALTLRNPVTRP